MKHERLEELLHHSFIEELTEEEHQVLNRHLAECERCRGEFEELGRLEAVVRSGRPAEPSDELLREARQELRVALRLETSRRPLWQKVLSPLEPVVIPQARIALGAAAVLVVGFFIGYLFFSPAAPTFLPDEGASMVHVATQRGETRVANFRFIGQEPQNGEVEFTFEMVTPVRMRGNINDNAVQKVLAQALLNEQNPGARLLTVSTLGRQVERTQVPDREIKAALLRALKFDPNAGVRGEALKILQKLPLDQEIKDAFFHVLQNESNPAMRIEVINSLEKPILEGQVADQRLLDVLRQRMEEDENNYIRIRARNVYEEVKQQ